MKRLLYILLLVISWNTLTAQTYQVNNQKIRFMNALGIPAKDTAAANWANAADTSIILIRPGDSTLWYKYKGDFRKVGTGGGTAIVDTVNTISSKPWRQKGIDSVTALISPRITDSLRLLVRLRASGSGGIQLQNSNGTNVADFGTANTTNGSIAGGWNVGGNLAVTGTSWFTGKTTFSDSIVGVNQRLSGNIQASTFNGSALGTYAYRSSGLAELSGAAVTGSSTFRDAANTYPVHISGNGLSNGIAIGTISGNFAAIQGYTNGFSATNNISLQPDGGNVGIGTSPSVRLHVETSAIAVGRLVTTNSFSSGYADAVQILAPNQTGGGLSFNFGKSESTYNLGKLVFNYAGNSSTSNFVGIGFYDNDGIVKVYASGATAFAGSVTAQGALTATAQGNNITVGVDSSVTSTSYTLVLGDAGYLKRCDNASTITITVPNNSSVAFPIGTTIYFSQKGAGKVTLSPASGVNLRSEGNLLGTAGQNAVIGIIKVNTNDFLVVGNRG